MSRTSMSRIISLILTMAFAWALAASAREPTKAECEQQTVPENRYSLFFDGFDDYATTSRPIGLANSSFTVAFWAKRSNHSKYECVVGQGSIATNQGLHIGFRDTNVFTFAFYNNDLDTLPADPITDSGFWDWHHWACTYDAATNRRAIYKDGVVVAEDVSTAHYQGSGDLLIGRAPWGNMFGGLVDDVGVWRTALEPEEVEAVATGTAATLDPAAFWRFELGTGEWALDESANANQATLHGPLWHTDVPYGVGEQDSYLAITDVFVWSSEPDVASPPGPAYTGVSEGTCTAPGKWVQASDVNRDIEGNYSYIWVKYELVPRTASTPVLTGIAVSEWPNWNVSCPSGYVNARGGGWPDAPTGALTLRTKSGCKRSGLCVRYTPMNQTETFISNLSNSYTDDSEQECPGLCASNAGFWTMQADGYNIHEGCGGKYMYLCYNEARHWPPMPTSPGEPDDTTKRGLLQAYAPRVWLADYEPNWPGGEQFYPSSVEWSFEHLDRVWVDGAWWLRTKQELSDPSDHSLPVFHGCDGKSTANPCTLDETPVYAFWDEVEIDVDGVGVTVVDLAYFMWYPYNRGKSVLGTTYGHHVGDWEHATVRLTQHWADDVWSLKPSQMYLAVHDFGNNHQWESLQKFVWKVWLPIIITNGPVQSPISVPDRHESDLHAAHTVGSDLHLTHPVVFAAWGSHGLWSTPGEHWYKKINLGITEVNLYDYTGYGTAWDTWKRVEAYDFDRKTGLGSSAWPVWMSKNYGDPSIGDANPSSGPIYRWGNVEDGSFAGQCRLCDGPTGPVDKSVWDRWILR